MGVVTNDKILSTSYIARVTGISRATVAALIVHYGIPVMKHASLTAVRPEARDRLIEVLERHPGVESGLSDRL